MFLVFSLNFSSPYQSQKVTWVVHTGPKIADRQGACCAFHSVAYPGFDLRGCRGLCQRAGDVGD